jgi:hypothetical protein
MPIIEKFVAIAKNDKRHFQGLCLLTIGTDAVADDALSVLSR